MQGLGSSHNLHSRKKSDRSGISSSHDGPGSDGGRHVLSLSHDRQMTYPSRLARMGKGFVKGDGLQGRVVPEKAGDRPELANLSQERMKVKGM